MKATAPLGASTRERAEHGCILTFWNADGKRLVLHRKGPPTKIVGPMCDDALAHDPSFRVISYSTPETIFTDLQGMRAGGGYSDGLRFGSPEAVILSRVGRIEMLHPSIRRASA